MAELEGQQKPWRWLLLAVLLILMGETWLAGRTARRQADLATSASHAREAGG